MLPGMNATDEAKKSLTKALNLAKNEVKKAQHEVGKIEKAIASLGGSATRKTTAKRKKSSGRPRKSGGRRDQVLKAIKASGAEGTSSGAVAKKLKVNPAQVSSIVTQLVKAKEIKKEGRKLTAV